MGQIGARTGSNAHADLQSALALSGAVFGVYGCLIGFLLLSRGSIPNKVLTHIRSSALAFIACNFLYALGAEGIDMAAHVGGLATGFLCGVTIRLPLVSGSVNRRWVSNGFYPISTDG